MKSSTSVTPSAFKSVGQATTPDVALINAEYDQSDNQLSPVEEKAPL
jgi:hypothetical protein